MLINLYRLLFWSFVNNTVPRKVLKEQYDYSMESDETHQIDLEHNDDLYDEDQFYRESEANPPAPKLQRELATTEPPSSVDTPGSDSPPPMRSRDSNQLEGMFRIDILTILQVVTHTFV